MAIIQVGVDEEEVEILLAEVDAVEAEDMYVLAYHLYFLIYWTCTHSLSAKKYIHLSVGTYFKKSLYLVTHQERVDWNSSKDKI